MATEVVLTAALAVTAALCFGAQTLLIQRGLDADRDASALGAAALTLVVSTLVLWGLVAARRGVPALPPVALLALFALSGVADPGFARLFYFEGIDRMGPTVPAAITAVSPAVAAVLAVAALGSNLRFIEVVGLGLVVAGVAVLQVVRPSSDVAGGATVRTGVIRRELVGASGRDFLFPLAATGCIAGSFVLAKVGLDAFPDTLTATAVTQTAALLLLLPISAGSGPARRYLRSPTRASVVAFLASGVVVAIGWYAMFLALEGGTVVAVLPVVSTYPLIVIAGTCLVERLLPRSLVLLGAVLAIVTGSIAVQLG